jgi:hypothetical protein
MQDVAQRVLIAQGRTGEAYYNDLELLLLADGRGDAIEAIMRKAQALGGRDDGPGESLEKEPGEPQ